MDWQKASKRQLLQIALQENCPLDLKYKAVSELQERPFRPKHDERFHKVISLFGQGYFLYEIANIVGWSDYRVQRFIERYGLWKGRLYRESRRID